MNTIGLAFHPGLLHAGVLFLFMEISRTVNSSCVAGIVLFAIGALAVRDDFVNARGLEKIIVLSNLCFAVPLAVFSAQHFSAAAGISLMVPDYMPWPLFWAYFVGVALLAASLSIATKVQVRWSGLLFGVMMFLFVAMMDIPATLEKPHDRFNWALTLREMSFGSGAWCLAASVPNGWPAQVRKILFTIGRIVIAITAMFYGVEHFLHPLHVPGVPLEMLMPGWVPGRIVIGVLTGVALLVCGASILLAKKTRIMATWLGSWILLTVLLVYEPILIASFLDPSTAVRMEGINYFFDTLLYAGTILAVAKAAAPAAEAATGFAAEEGESASAALHSQSGEHISASSYASDDRQERE
jgi:uncharacterized membrane protein